MHNCAAGGDDDDAEEEAWSRTTPGPGEAEDSDQVNNQGFRPENTWTNKTSGSGRRWSDIWRTGEEAENTWTREVKLGEPGGLLGGGGGRPGEHPKHLENRPDEAPPTAASHRLEVAETTAEVCRADSELAPAAD